MSTFESVLEDDRQVPRLCLRCQNTVSAVVNRQNLGVQEYFLHDLHGWCSYCKLITAFFPRPLRHDEPGLVKIHHHVYSSEVFSHGERLGRINHGIDMPRSAIVANTTGLFNP